MSVSRKSGSGTSCCRDVPSVSFQLDSEGMLFPIFDPVAANIDSDSVQTAMDAFTEIAEEIIEETGSLPGDFEMSATICFSNGFAEEVKNIEY